MSRKHVIKHPSSKARKAVKTILKEIFEGVGMKLWALIRWFKGKYKGALFEYGD
jgi:hypothetical protein